MKRIVATLGAICAVVLGIPAALILYASVAVYGWCEDVLAELEDKRT